MLAGTLFDALRIASELGQTVFAAEEFFFGRLRNGHTRMAYLRSVRQFLG